MSALVLCSACTRHFRFHEANCPFCGACVANQPPAALVPSGASRSRRYAASAALLASTATFSCGGSGNASDTQGAGGSVMTETTGGSGGSVNSAGSAQTGGTSQLAEGRACPDYEDTGNCRISADCADMPSQFGMPFYCAMTPQTYSGCGNPTFLQMCPPDGCGEGMVCVQYSTCGDSGCMPECTEATCSGESHCVDGQCVVKDCELDGAAPCPDGYECDPDATSYSRHCVPPSCEDGNIECDPWKDCDASGSGADINGCAVVSCTSDGDCGCGYCVNSRCEPTLGNCYEQQPAMPYGCVWPDEELV